MKNFLICIIAVISLTVASCSDKQDVPSVSQTEEIVYGGRIRTQEEAINFALEAKNHFTSPKSRGSFTVKNVKCYGDPNSRSGASTDSLYYIVNFDNDEGYAIVGADIRIPSVLAVIDHGNFDDRNIASGSSREYMLDLVKDYSLASTLMEGVTPVPIDTLREELRYWEYYCDTLAERKERMLKLMWNQNGTYAKYSNSLFEHPETISVKNIGCTPLAMGMVMSYFKYPESIKLTFDKRNQTINMDWDAIEMYDSEDYYYYTPWDFDYYATGDQIALYLRQIAEIAHSSGKPTGAVGTPENNIIPTMQYFGYNCVKEEPSGKYSIPKPSIEMNKMIICNGYDGLTSQTTTIGHTFVLDGVDYLRTERGYRIWQHVGIGVKLIGKEEVVESLRDHVHVNWGWGGIDNGYYLAGLFLEATYRKLDKYSYGTQEPFKFKRFTFYAVSR